MKKILYLVCFLGFLGTVSSISAQELKRCGTDEIIREHFAKHPELYPTFVKNELELDKLSREYRKDGSTVYIIPIVFHILHENGTENISDAQVVDAVNILNRDFRKLNADTIQVIPPFRPMVADVGIEFRLAQLDPDGKCTNGIDRIYTSKTNWANDSAKLNPWPREKYLNVWTARTLSTGWAGYAYYPSAATGDMMMRDGIMILQNYIGSIGTSNANQSRALTHEVGHWLDLGHPWNRTINISINVELACGDDGVEDTPITKGHTTCPNLYTPNCINESLADGIFNFDNTTTSSGKTDTTPVSPFFDQLTIAPFKAVGLSDNSVTNGTFNFTGWPTGAPDGADSYSQMTGSIDTSRYYEVTVTPKSGNSMYMTEISFNIKRSSDGPRTFAMRTSANNFNGNFSASSADPGIEVPASGILFIKNDDSLVHAQSKFNFGSSYKHTTKSATIRLYAWNSENDNGSFEIDSVIIKGTAGVMENIQNFMEYSYCCVMYTAGQMARMRAAAESPISGRSNLWSEQNLNETGVNNPAPCIPQADFSADRTHICVGNSVVFTKNISAGTETELLWTFEGGSPVNSTAAKPTVSYVNPGTFKVSLKATNALGSDSIVKEGFIVVKDGLAEVTVGSQFYEGFENNSIGSTWQSNDLDNNQHKWQWYSGSGTNGSNAAGINALGSYTPDQDELISPSFDLTGSQTAFLSFKYAGAALAPDNVLKDELNVFLSKDCGKTWTNRLKLKVVDLINNDIKTGAFLPDQSTVWTTKTISIPSLFITNHLNIKFEYTSSDSSNNFYLDDINLSQTVGIKELTLDMISMELAPNPSKDLINLNYELPANASTSIEVIDLLGREVYQSAKSNQSAGTYSHPLSKQNPGVYLVKLAINHQSFVKKVIWTE